jgi:hypothetical protein
MFIDFAEQVRVVQAATMDRAIVVPQEVQNEVERVA